MKIDHIIQEALPISMAKQYVKAWDPNFHKQVFDQQPRKDKNAYRVYIPFEQETDRKITIPQNLLDYLQVAIPGKPYTTDAENYMQGLAFEVSNPTRKLGIGKMLARSEGGEKDPTRKAELQALKKAFDADPQRAATRKADKWIVISRHPYDVAGMSTDRGWRSCMNLVDGVNRHYVLRDVKRGSIIAYLIHADDLNVRKPLARILIKPYQQKGNPKNIAMMGDAVYGTAPTQFKTLVDAWINKNYNEGKGGLFCLAKGLYRDVIPQQIELLGDDQIKQMPMAKLVLAAIKDHQLWPRVVQLRSDADEILWQVAERSDSRAARLIKQIDLTRFKKAIKRKGQILARLHTQTPEMVQVALAVDPEYVRFVRNRTPAQHELVLKLVKDLPDVIRSVHVPTAEQLNYALQKDADLLEWMLQNHADKISADVVKSQFKSALKSGYVDDDKLNQIATHYPLLLQDAQVFALLSSEWALWIISHMKLTPTQTAQLLMKDQSDVRWDSWWEGHEHKLIRSLKQLDVASVTPELKSRILRRYPVLVGAFTDWDEKLILPAIKAKPHVINHIQNPSSTMVLQALKSSEYDEDINLDRLNTPEHAQAWRAALKQNPELVEQLDAPTLDQLKQVLSQRNTSTWLLTRLLGKSQVPLGIKVRIIKRQPELIDYVNKPVLALQMAAVNADPLAYDRIKPKDRHPAVKAYMAAYRKEMRNPE